MTKMDEFTLDMTSGFRGTAKWMFAEFVGKPIHYLEVGIYEGRSGCWMLDNVLTHPLADHTGVDVAQGDRDAAAHETAIQNFSRHKGKYVLIRGDSTEVLPALVRWQARFEIVYIDGGHAKEQCLADLNNAWPLVAPGGVLLCDDYLHPDYGVKEAVDQFIGETGLEPFYKDYQVAWRKL